MATTRNYEDRPTVNETEYYEMKFIADKFGIDVWQVYKVKHDIKSNRRKDIYKAILNNQVTR